jgi:hypothetical protein
VPVEPSPTPPAGASPTPVTTPEAGPQFIAYLRDGSLLVTDVTGGAAGATETYSYAGVSGFTNELVWSPDGTRLAFTGTLNNEPHIIYVSPQNVGGGLIDDLGPGSRPAWAPDSKTLALVRGGFPDESVWTIDVETREARQLTFETNYAWGSPAFTPDGQALVVAGVDRNDMGAQGNTSFLLERLELDGSGAHAPLPGATLLEGTRLPYDLRFSPDGTRLAFSSSYHLSACAAPGAYYVSAADGSNRQELISPSLKAALDPNQELYHIALGYGWAPASNALAASGAVVNCDPNSPEAGQEVAGPQLSILGLDGSEGLVIPGYLTDMSLDRTGAWLAASHYVDFQDPNPVVEVYSAQSGELLFSLGPGRSPRFQPIAGPAGGGGGPCELTAGAGVSAYTRPSLSADVFGEMPAGAALAVLARTADGWLGFDPGVAQAANTGVFRLRWVQAAQVSLSGNCEGVPEVVGPAAGVCYTMPMENVPVYQAPDTTTPVLTTLQVEQYAAVLGVMGEDWAQVDLAQGNSGPPAGAGAGWIERVTLNLNGPCDNLPEVTP